MKGRVALFLLFTLLVTATQAHQLIKLPFFISHYQHYSQDHHAGGLLTFIHDHYLDTPEQSTDGHEDHEKLPFHSQDSSSISKLPVSPPLEEDMGQVIIETSHQYDGQPVRELRAQPSIEITVPPPQVELPAEKPEPRACKCDIGRPRGDRNRMKLLK